MSPNGPSWTWMLFFILCFTLVWITNSAQAVTITSLTAPVILTNLPFTIGVEIVYDSTTLTATTEINFLVLLDDGQLIANMTKPAWTPGQDLVTKFLLDDPQLIINRPGLGFLNVSASSTTDPLDTGHSVKKDISVVPAGVSLVPLIVTLFLAAFSGSVIISLLSGIWIAAMIEFQDIVEASVHSIDTYILEAIIDPGHTTIIMFTMFLGGMLSMMRRSGGATGMANFLARFVDSSRKAQAVTFLTGLCMFFDDYASLLLTGSTMRPITDAQFVSREKLAFVVDSIAAPMAALVPISSWTAFESILIETEARKLLDQGFDLPALGFETSGFLGFLRLVPYMFYPTFLLIFQVTVIATALEFGPMLSAERRAKYRHVLIDDEQEAEEERVILADDDPETVPTPNTPTSVFNALIPISLLITLTIGAMIGIGLRNYPELDPEASSNLFAYTDGVLALLYSTAFTCVFQVLVYRFQFRPFFNRKVHIEIPDPRWLSPIRVFVNKVKAFAGSENHDPLYSKAQPLIGFREGVECWLAGVKTMAPSVVVLVLAWSIGGAMDRIGIGQYLASSIASSLSPASLPPLVFILSSGVSVATGSSFGTMSLLFPIVSPLAFSASLQDPETYYASLAGILAGSVYGCHISPISDTTILASMSTRCDLQKHVLTQFPYATLVAFWALVIGCIPSGLKTLPPVATNLLGLLFVILSVLILGAPVSSPRGRMDCMTYVYAMIRWKILGHNPARIEALRLQVIVVEEEGDKDDVVGQGIKRDYMIWALRRTFNSTRFTESELQREHRKSRHVTNRASADLGPSMEVAKVHDIAISNVDEEAKVHDVAISNVDEEAKVQNIPISNVNKTSDEAT